MLAKLVDLAASALISGEEWCLDILLLDLIEVDYLQ